MNRIFLAAVIACVPLILPVSKMTEVKAVAESVQTEAEFLGERIRLPYYRKPFFT